MARSFASGPTPSFLSRRIPFYSSEAVATEMFAGRPHRLPHARHPSTGARWSIFGFGSRGDAATTQVCTPMVEDMVPRARAPRLPLAAGLTAASFALARRAHCHRSLPRSRSAAASTACRWRRCGAPAATRRCRPAAAASAHAARRSPPAATRPPRASGRARRRSRRPRVLAAPPSRAAWRTYRLPLRMGAGRRRRQVRGRGRRG